MPDASLGSDPLASAFATFMADAGGEIETPGSARARRTVRHRRVRTAVAAACVLIAATGFGLAGMRHAIRPAPTSKKAVSEAALVARADTVIGAIAPLIGSSGVNAYGVGDGPVDGPVDNSNSNIVSLATVGAGTYELVMACAGTGSVQVTVYRAMGGGTPVGAPVTSRSVPCNSTAVQGQIHVAKGQAGTLWITYGGDSAAIGHAGVAYGLIEPILGGDQLNNLQAQAQAAVARADGVRTDGMSASNIIFGNRNDSDFGGPTGVPAGRYSMMFYCRGAGQVTVTWTIGRVSTSAVANCGDVPGTHLLLTPTTVARMTVDIAPLLGTQGHAAYAYGVWPD